MYYISRFKDNFTLDYINIIINGTNESFNILILPNYICPMRLSAICRCNAYARIVNGW